MPDDSMGSALSMDNFSPDFSSLFSGLPGGGFGDLFSGTSIAGEPSSTPDQTGAQPVNPITMTDVGKLTDENQNNIMRMIKDLQSQRSFGGAGMSDLQQLRNILSPRTAAGSPAPSISPGEQTASDVQRAKMMGNTKLELQKKMFDQLFGGGQGPLISRIIASLGGMFGGGTSGPPAGQDLQVGNIVKAMQALNASNAQKQQESLSNRFAALGRSPASTVLSDLQNRIGESQSLSNIQGAGEIERLMLPVQEQRERLAAELSQQRERMMESFVQNLLNQVLGGSFGLASSIGG